MTSRLKKLHVQAWQNMAALFLHLMPLPSRHPILPHQLFTHVSAPQKGKIPKALEDLIRDEEEETPDLVLEIPANKVKLVIGPGGERVKLIQKRTKCRVQHAKDEADLGRGFGVAAAPAAAAAAHAAEGSAPGGKTVKLHLFGNAEACEAARAMIMESIDNREQKAKQRAKEYEKKRETKRGERQIYHLRHARDYEILGLPLGASKAEAKVAFRKLALKWHPDKNRGEDWFLFLFGFCVGLVFVFVWDGIGFCVGLVWMA